MPGSNFTMKALCFLCVVLLTATNLFIGGVHENLLLRSPIVRKPYAIDANTKSKSIFCCRRIAYYSNSDCTFRLELLKSGDIQSNPGPDAGNEISANYSCAIAPRTSPHQCCPNSGPYKRQTLLDIQSRVNYRLENKVWANIKSIEINARPKIKRGHKGGRNRRTKCVTVDDKSECQLGLWNARSINGKVSMVCDLIISKQLDIFALSETWLYGDDRDNSPIADLLAILPTHTFLHIPRKNQIGGGVGVCLCKTLRVKQNMHRLQESFEYIDLTMSESQRTPLRLVVVYRPQRTQNHQQTASLFIYEFSSYLELLVSDPSRLLITGDFNFHVDDEQNWEAQAFMELISSFDLVQHVAGSTHERGHTLDLVLSRASDDLVSNVATTEYLPSDHAAVTCSLSTRKPDPVKLRITTRKIDAIDVDTFCRDILESELYTHPSSDLNTLVDQYDHVLRDLLDKHAPLLSKEITCRPNAPWYNDELRKAKQNLRRLEHKKRSSGLEVNNQNFKFFSSQYCHLIREAKKNFHVSKFRDCDYRDLFKKVQKLCDANQTMVLPSTDSDELLAERFSKFFKEKISRIIDKLHTASSASADSPSDDQHADQRSSVAFVKFTPISVQQAIKLVADSPSSTCVLDPISTHLLKRCKSVIGPIIAQIINLSFDQGLFPDSLKHSQVKPLLKNSKLDADDLNSYRPIANLKFISKALERAAASQIQCYLAAKNLNSIMQSAYWKNHSCETVLLKVCNDLLLALDCGQEAVPLMLDYSAAFDTLSHSILLLRLRNRFGFSSAAFDWIESYIKGRSHFFVIRGKMLANQELLRGVPQGSVLGPILFTVYSSPLEDIIKAHGFGHAIYADDTQVYAIVNRDDWPNVIPRLEACLQEISSWSSENGLSINEGKTELIHLASRHRTRSLLPPLIFSQQGVLGTLGL